MSLAIGFVCLLIPYLTIDEIHTKVPEIGEAAKLVKDVGYAGVDIHALHWGHLIDSFALSFMNHRDDEYGGSLENRLRITKEIREEISQGASDPKDRLAALTDAVPAIVMAIMLPNARRLTRMFDLPRGVSCIAAPLLAWSPRTS